MFDETSFAKIEVSGPGAAELLEQPVRQPRGPRGRSHRLHPDAQPARRDRVRLHGLATHRGPVRDRHRHGVRPSRPGLDRQARRRGHVRVEDVTSRWACVYIWGPKARDVLAGKPPPTTSPSATCAGRSSRSATCRCARSRHVRRRARLGALLPDGVRQRAVATLWEAGQPHGVVAGGYARSTRCGWRRATASGAPTSPDDTPYEGASALASAPTRTSSARALVDEPERRLCCLALADPRSVALGNEPVRVGDEIAGRVTSGGYGYTVERSIAYAYLPGRARRSGHRDRRRDLRRVGRRRGRDRAIAIRKGFGSVSNILICPPRTRKP